MVRRFRSGIEIKNIVIDFFCFIHFAWVVWCTFFFIFPLFVLKKLQSGLFVFCCRIVLSLVWMFCFALYRWFFSFHKNLQFCSRTLINCSVTSLCLLHIFFVFNYKSVAVCECKINVHDYRTGKNSWLRTVHVNLILFLFICAIKPLSRVCVFFTKIPFFAARCARTAIVFPSKKKSRVKT